MISSYYNTYTFSSTELKRRVTDVNPIVIITVFLDIISSVIFGIYFEPNFYIIPFLILGVIGAWKYNVHLLCLFQFIGYGNQFLRAYTIFFSNQYYLLTAVPIQFYTTYKIWIYLGDIKILNNSDLQSIRNGWTYMDDYF